MGGRGGGLSRHRRSGGRLTRLPGHAVLAPSGRNTQPWRFRVPARTVEL